MTNNKLKTYLLSGIGILAGVGISQGIKAELNKPAPATPAQTQSASPQVASSDAQVPSNEEPAWVNYAAARMCTYLERGLSPYKAGYEGMKDVLESDQHAGAAIRAYNRLGEEKSSVMAATAAMQRCPSALIKATRNHTGA